MKEISGIDYQIFLRSPEWECTSEEVKKRDHFKCRVCGTSQNLRVHHLRYGDDILNLEDLITVCDNCHKCLHKSVDAYKDAKRLAEKEIREKLSNSLANSVMDFYRNSFLKGDMQVDICNHDDFSGLEFALRSTISGLVYDKKNAIDYLSFENKSKQKCINARADYIKRAVHAGKSKSYICNMLRINERQFYKLLNKYGGSDG